MNPVVSTLTILFDPPFWIGICEREYGGHYEVCKITFGAEPKDYEVYSFLLQSWHRLRFYSSIEAVSLTPRRVNPKRMQRLIAGQIANTGMGTKAQRALKLQRNQEKLERKTRLRQRREREKERRFALRQEKRKEKHRGH